jgi:hypothetical protein
MCGQPPKIYRKILVKLFKNNKLGENFRQFPR